MPDPIGDSERDRPACGCDPGRTGSRCRRAKSTRSRELRSEFTRCQQVLCPHRRGRSPGRALMLFTAPASSALSWANATRWRRSWSSRLVCAAPAGADGGRLSWPLRPRPAVVAACSTRRRRTGSAAIAASTWPGCPASRCTPPGRGRWCSPGSWPVGRWCRWPTPAGCGPATSRSRRRCGRASGSTPARRSVELAAGHAGCPAPACLHWGAMWGPAAAGRLRRPARAAGDDTDPAQTPAPLTRITRLLRDRELAVDRDLCAVSTASAAALASPRLCP